jgi:hypothetical protein
VIYSETQTNIFADLQIPLGQTLLGFVFFLLAVISIYAQTPVISQPDEKTIVIENAQSEVFSFGKTVVVKGSSQGVLAFGGDIIVEGKVDGDVATIGGSIIQKENAFIGGDVIIFGGTYRPESKNPLRTTGKETVMIAVFEDELRNLTQNPSQIFSPSFSPAFLAQRILSILFWFVLSLALTTISPGALSRAIARFSLSTLKIIAIGFFSFLGTTVGVMACLNFLPNYINAIVVFMVFLLLILAYVFGRVALQLIVGKQLQKQFLPESKQSETLAILIGVIVWTIFLSVPYLWAFALLALISASIGLVLTARTSVWQKS